MEVIITLGVIAAAFVLWNVLKRGDDPEINLGHHRSVDFETINNRLSVDAIRGRVHPWVGKDLEFDYHDHAGASTRRRVTVHSVFESDGKQFVQGQCHLRNDTRYFRLDRIRGELVDVNSGEVVGGKKARRRTPSAARHKPRGAE